MTSKIQQAREAGYSDSEIFGYLTKKDPSLAPKFAKAREAGYDDSEIIKHLEEQQMPSKARSVASAPVKGLVRGVNDLASMNPFTSAGPIPKNLQEKFTEKFLPTRPEKAEKYLERAGRLAPAIATGGEGLALKGAQLAGGTLAGQLAEDAELGPLGQSIAELAGIGVPGLARGAAKKVSSLAKAPVEKLPSGITKPRAMDSKFAEKGIISPERQAKAFKQLDKEASALSKSSIEKRLPLAKKLEEGFDFESTFEKGFGDLQKSAERANPTIDITDIGDLLSTTSKKYRGIPNLHPEGKKVMQEVQALANRPQTSLKNLLRIYRSNNRKKSGIYETSRLTGRQKEYVDFLNDVNRNIVKSFERTLPKDSQWLKNFKELNADYSQVQKSKEALSMLEPILQERATPAAFQRLATDAKKQKKLMLAMGKEGADEVIQIAKDTQAAREAIKRIPAKEWKAWQEALPFTMLIPGLGVFGKAFTTKKAIEMSRRAYGSFLLTHARRKSYEKALKAVENKNLSEYIKATDVLKKQLDSQED